MKNWSALVGFSLVAFFAQQVQAVESPFETTIVSGVEGTAQDSVYILPKVTNKGGVPLTKVHLSAFVDGKLVSGREVKPRLEPGEQLISNQLTAKVNYKKPGSYPVILYTDYRDASDIVRAVPAIGYVSYKVNDPQIALAGTMADVNVLDKGVLNITVVNKGSKEVRGRVLALIPTEFVVTNTERPFVLKAGGEETFSFEFKNYNAPPGSFHTAYAVIEGEDDKTHYANGVSSRIKLEAPAQTQTAEKGSSNTSLIIVIVLLALAGSAFIILRKTGGSENR